MKIVSGEASATSSPQAVEVLAEFRAAVTQDLQMLAVLHDREPSQALIEALRSSSFPESLGLTLESERGVKAQQLLKETLDALPESLDEETQDELAVDYADIYLTYNYRAAPCESVWIDDENLGCQLSMFQVREWYERHGLAAPDWRKRPDDHLVMQLQFAAHLIDPSTEGELDEAARFLDEHLLRWLLPFGERVARRCNTPFFAGVALLTAAYGEELRELLAEILGEPRPSQKEIDKRMHPAAPVQEVPIKFMPGLEPGW